MSSQSYSYSRISKFNQCPRAFYHQYVVKDAEYTTSEAAEYGSEMHDFIDQVMRGTKDFSPRYEFLRPLIENLKSIKGEVQTEYGLGFNEDRTQTTFDDRSAFVKGKSDCTIFHPSEPRIMIKDWKFAAVKPENYTLEMDMFVMLHFWAHPDIERIDTELVWLKVPAPEIGRAHV